MHLMFINIINNKNLKFIFKRELISSHASLGKTAENRLENEFGFIFLYLPSCCQ